jgi:di/tricarboxylate transporter
MQANQLLILAILGVTVALFLWGRWRHDMVAAAALLACVLTGLLPAQQAFLGFAHPAVITVACVLVLSRALQLSGAVDVLARYALPQQAGVTRSLLAMMGLGAILSGFMNNVGALALLMPLAIPLARRLDLQPGQVLMPLAFGTILGGMTTLIGTPPNLIVSGFREQTGAGGFAMFDFTPVGLVVATVGVLLVGLVGWRLVPARRQTGIEGFVTGAYITEARVQPDSLAAGKTLRELEPLLDEAGAQVVGLVRYDLRVTAPHSFRHVREGDILVIEADAEALPQVLSSLGLKLEESVQPGDSDDAPDAAAAPVRSPGPELPAKDKPSGKQDIVLMELAVRPASPLEGRSASDIELRSRYGLNLLAVSRHGQRALKRLRLLPLRAGDLLLMQGPPDALAEFAADSGCVPLAERELKIPSPRKAWTASIIMLLSVGAAATGLLPAAVAFALGVLASMVFRTLPLRSVYEAVDWPVVVLLAALIPVAKVMETTGTAEWLARTLLDGVAQGNPVLALVLVMVVTMTLSDLVNNAATAAVMCPIALGTAAVLGVHPDAFLMAVAIGASCAFMTPIAHQNNTLILGPGGFGFGDFWRLGIVLELMVVLVGVPLLMWVWPL